MSQTELTKYHQGVVDALMAYLDLIKRAPGVPDQAAMRRVYAGVEAALAIHDELRKRLPPDPEPVQVSLLDVPQRKGGY